VVKHGYSKCPHVNSITPNEFTYPLSVSLACLYEDKPTADLINNNAARLINWPNVVPNTVTEYVGIIDVEPGVTLN